MMPLVPVSLSFGAALLLGLSFGSGPCNIACLPYLGPVFVATGNGVRQAWRTLLPFSLGRMTGYALLGGAAGWAGLLVEEWIASPWVCWEAPLSLWPSPFCGDAGASHPAVVNRLNIPAMKFP